MNVERCGRSDDLIYVRFDGTYGHEIRAYVAAQRGRCYRQVLKVRSVGGARGIRAHAIPDSCGPFAAGQREDGRPISDGGSITVQPESSGQHAARDRRRRRAGLRDPRRQQAHR